MAELRALVAGVPICWPRSPGLAEGFAEAS